MTLPHDAGDALDRTRRLAADGWRRVQQGRAWQTLKDAAGITGTIRTMEVTHGVNGWHPHVHALVLTARPLIATERDALLVHAFTAWRKSAVAAGQRAPLPQHSTISAVRSASDVAAYVTKIGAALEMTQGAAKTGRLATSRTPFAVLADFLEHGDDADLTIWRQWEAGITGAQQLTWSRGLKAQYAVAEVDDEALAAEKQGGITHTEYNDEQWAAICSEDANCRLHEVGEAALRAGQNVTDALMGAVAAIMARQRAVQRVQ